MAMDDILKALVDSRQQQNAPSQGPDPMSSLIGSLLGGGGGPAGGGQADAMTGLLGSLLGGGQPQAGGSSPQSDPLAGMLGSLLGGESGGASQTVGGGQQPGLGGMMSLLEMFTGGGQSGISQSMAGANPMMGLLQPLVEPLAKKLKISPELAMIAVAFVLQKMLAHHPTSGRDSTQFNIDDMFSQLSAGKLDPNMIKNSGMAEELARVTGMDNAAASKTLNAAFTMVGQRALQAAAKPAAASRD